jgi:Domain of unknown function (DUF4190)
MNEVTVVRTSSTAIVSLIFGILTWFVLPVIGAIVAVICGHAARSEIRRSGGQLEGGGLALAGLILGWTHLLLLILAVSLFMLPLAGGFAWMLHWLHHLQDLGTST